MTYDEAQYILALNQEGRYRGSTSRLVRAIEIVAGDEEPGCEEVETVWGAFELEGES